MKIRLEDGTVTQAVGFVNLSTHIVPRAELAHMLRDIGRFERWLPVAQRIDTYMSEHDGATPPEFTAMSTVDRLAVTDTLRELGELQRQAAEACRAEVARRGAHG